MISSPPQLGKLVLLIGPSGVGKSVILLQLRKRHPELHFPKSATTRAKRPNESSNLYHFVTDVEFDELIQKHELLEWAQVHGGARYGTLMKEIIPPIEEGKIVVREVDVQGFESITSDPRFSGDDARYKLESIFILPENRKQLIKHITKRAPIASDELARRIESMDKELAYADQCTIQIKNIEGKLEETINEVERSIFS